MATVRGKQIKRKNSDGEDESNNDVVATVDPQDNNDSDDEEQQEEVLEDQLEEIYGDAIGNIVCLEAKLSMLDPDIETNPVTQLQMVELIEEANDILLSLDRAEEKLIYFHFGSKKKIKCPFCEHKGHSFPEESNSVIAYLVIALLCFFIGWYAVILIPFILGITRIQTHRCPKCLNEIKNKSIFNQLDDDILQIQIKQFGVLVKRRTLVSGLVIILLLIACYFCFDQYYGFGALTLETLGSQINTTLHWKRYIKECGKKQDVKIASERFVDKYLNEKVSWEGYVMRVDLVSDTDIDYSHVAQVLIQMDPRDIPASLQKESAATVDNYQTYLDREPDIKLTFTLDMYNYFKEDLAVLRSGD